MTGKKTNFSLRDQCKDMWLLNSVASWLVHLTTEEAVCI